MWVIPAVPAGTGERHRHRCSALVAQVAVLAVALTACGDSDTGSSSTGGLHSSLSRIQATDVTARYIEYGDNNRITGASGGSFQGSWGTLDGWGQSKVFPYRNELPAMLGIDIAEADAVATVGQQPHSITLVQGGQDAGAVVSAATTSGWTESDGVLKWTGGITPPTAISTPVIRPDGSDVMLASAAADISVVGDSDSSLADDPVVGELATCLGDVVAALIFSGDYLPKDKAPAAGVGVRRGTDDTPVSVMCVWADSKSHAADVAESIENALASGTTPRTARPYSWFFADPAVDVMQDGQVVRLVATNTPEAFANTILQMTMARELPGFGRA